MSAPASLLPADTEVHVAVRAGAAREVDRLHDHVLRILADEEAAGRVTADVATRARARADELGEAPTFERLVALAHARMAVVDRQRPSDALVARLAGASEPGGGALVRALSVPTRRGAALLDLTVRHDIDLRRAAALVRLERGAAAARTEALRRVRSHLADAGLTLDVGATLARLPVVGAPASVHQLVDLPDVADTSGRLPASLAWLGTAAVVIVTIAGVAFGMPRLVSADTGGNLPVAVAEEVSDTPAAQQLSTPGDDAPPDEVEQLVVQEPATHAVAPPSPAASDEES